MLNLGPQLATQQPTALKVIGPLVIVLGLAIIGGAIVDPAKVFTKMYEYDKKHRMGLATISRGPPSYRFWCILMGLFGLALGIAMVAIVF
jgi:hypothetical protein